jgi:hypothetical protein
VPRAASADATDPTPHILTALVAAGGELAKTGISKDRKNEQQNFRFRGIDDVMNAVSPILGRHGIVFLVDYEDYPDVERVTAKGSTLIYTKVKGTFTFLSAQDGSQVSVTTFGVAMDSGDKATNKAMSAALKYALLQTFLIPTEAGSEDADAVTQEASIPKPAAGFEEWFTDVQTSAERGVASLKRVWFDPTKEAFREYASAFRNEELLAAKRKSAAVDKAKREAQAQAPA